MKLCKDCKHYRRMFRECVHPNAYYEVDYVDGKIEYHTANFMRKLTNKNSCGTKAVLFEPKESKWNEIKNYFKGE